MATRRKDEVDEETKLADRAGRVAPSIRAEHCSKISLQCVQGH
jgi:hypothetical protein